MCDFDTEFDRRNTGSYKWDFSKSFVGKEKVLPMWVADMDFQSPKCVREALIQRATHGIYGYTLPQQTYYEAVISWFSTRFGYTVKPEWIVLSPGIETAISMAIQGLTEPGDKIIIQPPVYHPFHHSIDLNNREIVKNELLEENGLYTMDFDGLEACAKQGAKMLILCNPHNPCGRRWTHAELLKLSQICLSHNILVLADEIHCDLTMPGFTHTSYLSLGEEAAHNLVLCTSPSKSFNMPGLMIGNIIIPNQTIRSAFSTALARCGIEFPNFFSITAVEAAYSGGGRWLSQVIDYIHNNYSVMSDFIDQRLPDLSPSPLEATYLAWIDFRRALDKLGMKDGEFKQYLLHKTGVWIREGSMFGETGQGFMRINIACPRKKLIEALEGIKKAITIT